MCIKITDLQSLLRLISSLVAVLNISKIQVIPPSSVFELIALYMYRYSTLYIVSIYIFLKEHTFPNVSKFFCNNNSHDTCIGFISDNFKLSSLQIH